MVTSEQPVPIPAAPDGSPPVDRTDIVVGVLTLNNAGTIESLVKAVVEGLRLSFPNVPALLVHCDAGSQDGTPGIVDRVASGMVPLWMISNAMSTYANPTAETGFPGRDESVRNLCLATERLEAKTCLLIEGNLRSLTPEWIEHLGRPVYEGGEDYVVPLYRRHRYEGTLVSNLLYPLIRALYGTRLRYPSGGAYGLSGKLARDLLKRPAWTGAAGKLSLDGWITTAALAGEYRVCHAYLGAKDQDSKLGTVDLSVLLAQTVGGIFHSMEEYETVWESIRGSKDVPLYGSAEPVPPPGTLPIDRMVSGFKQGLRDLLPLWELILSRETLEQILPLGMLEGEDFRFAPELWVQTVYDFALAYHDHTLHRQHMLKSLTPLYLGRTASFVLETRDGDAAQVEHTVDKLCRQFEQSKPYLTERWRWRNE
ncbi:MAG: hypothetical protein OJF52_000818 [Nitrospira sp.]|jgi:hypothetical protein|nr:MAG: hypothetical protein OJF52_000818 [Nitrospira sp.]